MAECRLGSHSAIPARHIGRFDSIALKVYFATLKLGVPATEIIPTAKILIMMNSQPACSIDRKP
jgi:hypothetical protein